MQLWPALPLATLGVAPTLQPQEPQFSEAPGRVRVSDALTSDPIAGAEVFGVAEKLVPMWGTFWSTVDATTDVDGRASIALPTEEAKYAWLIVRADGYAPYGAMRVSELQGDIVEIELQPVVPARVRIVDFLGRPIPNVHLGVCVGCGHTPDVARSATDQEGRATLLAVGAAGWDIADVYPVGSGVYTDYLAVDWNRAIREEQTIMVDPGGVIDGTILWPDGSPASGVAVGENRLHRGPWAMTDEAGRFQLFGVSPDATWLAVHDGSGEQIGSIDCARPGVHRTFQLPNEPFAEERAHLEPATLPILVNVPETDGIADGFEKSIPLLIWDTTSGWTSMRMLEPNIENEVELTVGTYEAVVGGLETAYERRHLGTIELLPETDAPVIETSLPEPKPFQLWLPDPKEDERYDVMTNSMHSTSIRIDSIEDRSEQLGPDGERVGIVEVFWRPAEPFALWRTGWGSESYGIMTRLEPASFDPSVLIAYEDKSFSASKR